MVKNKRFYRWRVGLAIFYFILPLTIIAIYAFVWQPSWVSKLTWRFIFCFLTGLGGLAMRAFHLREFNSSPWPEYFTIYPVVVAINASAVFTVLTLFDKYLVNPLFYTAAVPLCMILGFFCHPEYWYLTRLITKAGIKFGP